MYIIEKRVHNFHDIQRDNELILRTTALCLNTQMLSLQVILSRMGTDNHSEA